MTISMILIDYYDNDKLNWIINNNLMIWLSINNDDESVYSWIPGRRMIICGGHLFGRASEQFWNTSVSAMAQ